MTLEEFETYAKEHDIEIVTRQQAEQIAEAHKILKENEQLKNRCHVYTKGLLCEWCLMKCEHKEGINGVSIR